MKKASYHLIEKLSRATPVASVLQWFAITALYAVSIIINDHFDLVAAAGLPHQYEGAVHLCGVLLYMILTTYQFQKTNNNKNYEQRSQAPKKRRRG